VTDRAAVRSAGGGRKLGQAVADALDHHRQGAHCRMTTRLSTSVTPGADHATLSGSAASTQERTVPVRATLAPSVVMVIFRASSAVADLRVALEPGGPPLEVLVVSSRRRLTRPDLTTRDPGRMSAIHSPSVSCCRVAGLDEWLTAPVGREAHDGQDRTDERLQALEPHCDVGGAGRRVRVA
jgi:hypothetical protein